MINWLKRVVGSKYFFISILLLFIAQSIWFAINIKFSIPPDETYHFKFIEFYSEQPILNGPIIDSQGDEYFYLGDIQRVPSYLYHYILSFPNRIFHSLSLDQGMQVILLRLINVIFAVFSILFVKKILEQISSSKFVVNISILLLSVTGMFVWISSAINYDNLSILTFLIYIYLLLRFIKKRTLLLLILSIATGLASILVKTTIAPTVLASLILMLIIYVYTYKNIKLKVGNSGKLKIFISIILLLIVSSLFTERIIGNMAYYGTAQPKCNVIHTHNKCLENGIYERNAVYKVVYGDFERLDIKDSKPLWYINKWSNLMYDRLYFYFGHKRFSSEQVEKNSAVMLISFTVFLCLGAIGSRKRKTRNRLKTFLFIISLSYILQVFIYNFLAYLKTGMILGGYQGRYLLPVIPFIYYLLADSIRTTLSSSTQIHKIVFTAIGLVIFTWFILNHLPIISFSSYAGSSWLR